MELVETKKIENKESLPWNLLLLTDHSRKIVDNYINSFDIYILTRKMGN